MKQITIRVNYSDWKKLRLIFPSFRGESMSAYLKRYIKDIREDTYNDKLGERQEAFCN